MQDFSTTRWTLIERLQGDDADREAAMQEIANLYWPAVYTFFRKLGDSRAQAEDLTQDFFVTVIMERSMLDTAAPGDGRLRTLIKKAAKNFRIDEDRRERTRPRIIDISIERLEAVERSLNVFGDNGGADEAYDRQWYVSVLTAAVDRAGARCSEDDRQSFALFERMILHPSVYGTEPPSRAAAAEQLGYPSEAAASSALYRIRKRTLATLHEVINETVYEPRDKAAEFESFLNAVRAGE